MELAKFQGSQHLIASGRISVGLRELVAQGQILEKLLSQDGLNWEIWTPLLVPVISLEPYAIPTPMVLSLPICKIWGDWTLSSFPLL